MDDPIENNIDSVPSEEKRLDRYRILGVLGVFVWILLFAFGVLVPSQASRNALGWNSGIKTDAGNLQSRIEELEKNSTKSSNPLTPKDTEKLAKIEERIATLEEKDAKEVKSEGVNKPEKPPRKFMSFIIASLAFTPINVAFLCILSAFIGGCSMNKGEVKRVKKQIDDMEAQPSGSHSPDLPRLLQRLDYLQENPGYSMIRGLVVYLIIISGLFIIGAPLTGENGDHSVSLAQYIKLAGLFSFFGYLSGHDPTVFSSIIGLGTKHFNSNKTPQQP